MRPSAIGDSFNLLIGTTLNDRVFGLPDVDAEGVEATQSRLPETVRTLLQQAGDALDRDRPDLARRALISALARAPRQPDVLRVVGLMHAQLGDFETAKKYFELALQEGANDALIYRQYAHALEKAGEIKQALRLREVAIECLPGSPLAWFDLGEHYFQYESMAVSVKALERAVELAPGYVPAMLKLGSALVYAGRIDEGATAYRQVLDKDPGFGAAWFSLANIKTLAFTVQEVEQMRQMLRDGVLRDPDRLAVEFALAKACEDDGDYVKAFSLLVEANARKRRQVDWSATKFSEHVRRNEQIFALPHASVEDLGFGNEVIFIVGLPRSGTTLTEQIIASHSKIEGANELGDLGHVLDEESARLRQHYPEWVLRATPDDWRRLGQHYLDATARWRRSRPRFTDKAPGNWLFLGAIRAMLPGARIVVCRRDPVENGWSCFKQFFFLGWDFTFSFEDIAAYWKDFDKTVSNWVSRDHAHVREQNYEALLANPEAEIRGLLDFCDLPFEATCLAFHETSRGVRTASAGQVRQPLQKNTARASHYGALLDPLRVALGMPSWTLTGSSAGERGLR